MVGKEHRRNHQGGDRDQSADRAHQDGARGVAEDGGAGLGLAAGGDGVAVGGGGATAGAA